MKHLAFDLGASSGRAIVGWAENGKLNLKEVHRFPNHPYDGDDGRLYWDFASLVKELRTGLKKAFEFAADIATFSVDTWGVDIVFFRDGKAIRQPFCYRDPRFCKAQDDAHKILPGRDCYALNGIQLMPFNTVYQLFAAQQDLSTELENAKMLFMPDALLASLTGEMTTEYTIASTGALLDPATRQWNPEIFRRLNLPQHVLTDITEPCTLGAYLKDDVCAELGVPKIQSVKCCSHDTASAVAALPSDKPEKAAYISLGTWALLGAETHTPNVSDAAFQAHYTNEGGLFGTLRFLTNITGTWLLQETRNTWNARGENISFAQMCDEAQAVTTQKRIDPNDPVFSAPGDMPARIADYCRAHGQGEFTSRGELLRCIYESLADCVKSKLSELESLQRTKYEKLHVMGGGTKDEFLMQLIANAAGIPVLAGPVEATAAGNILAQMLAVGELKDLAEGRTLIAGSFELKNYLPE